MKSYNLYNELYLSNKINNPFHVIFFFKKKKKKKKKKKINLEKFQQLRASQSSQENVEYINRQLNDTYLESKLNMLYLKFKVSLLIKYVFV